MKTLQNKIFATIGIIFLSVIVVAQTGPGGVGNSDGSNGQPRNILWLNAGSLSLADGAEVSGWSDISGNSHNMTGNGAATDPTYKTGIINGESVVRFENDNNEYLDFYPSFNTSSSDGVVGSTYTFFYVAARRDASQNNQYVFGGDASSNNRNIYSGWGYPGGQSLAINHWGNNCAASSGSYYTDIDNEFGFISCVFNSASGGITRELFDKGTSVASTSDNSNLGTLTNTKLAFRGGSGNDYGDVDIAELIFYNTNLNTAQKRIVENYLSQKYAIGFQTASNDKYGTDPDYDNSYTHNISGIGQESDGDHTETTSGGVYLSENNTSLGNGEYVMIGHNNATNSAATATAADLVAPTEKRWARDWYIEKDGTVDVTLTFDFKEALSDGEYPENPANYVLLFRSGTSGNYAKVTVAASGLDNADEIYFDVDNANFETGYYTIGTDDQINSPIEGVAGRTWYALGSGDWDTWNYWTLNSDGVTPNNPGEETPTFKDKVVIYTGKTITLSSNNKTIASATIEGVLQLGTTSGHKFTEIKGGGRIRLAGDNFPDGDATHFATAMADGGGEGTVVWQGGSYDLTLANTNEFFNMEFDLDNASETLTLLNDLTLNGNLLIETGTLRINDTGTDAITINANGDVTVKTNGEIEVGTGDTYGTNSEYHKFYIKGNFLNEGISRFTNRGAADYTNDDTGGAVDVIFNSASSDQTAQCNGTTVFNILTCDKGIDATYTLSVTANNTNNFKIYGRNNQDWTGGPGSIDNNKALHLLAGTLKLGSNIVIPELADNYEYVIDSDAELWIADNADVTNDNNDYIYVFGELHISGTATFTETTDQGVIIREQGTVRIEGGTCDFEALTTSVIGDPGTQIGAYIQTGGTVNINDERRNEFAPFHLPFKENVFIMSGGTIHIKDQADGGEADDFAFIVNSEDGNSNVTGGTIILDNDYNNSAPYRICTRAPLWNLIIRDGAGAGNDFLIEELTGTTEAEDISPAPPLRILNDFTIEGTNSPVFKTQGTDVYIGRNFIIEEGAEQAYEHDNNTTIFNGTEDGELYIGHSTNDGYEQLFYNLTIDKAVGSTLLLTGDSEKEAANVSNLWWSRLVQVTGAFVHKSGIFNQGEHSVRLFGTVELQKDATLGVYIDNTTETNASIVFRGDGLTVETEEGAEIGNFKMDVETPGSDEISFTSDVYIVRMGYKDGKINMGPYNIKIDYLHDTYTKNNLQIDDSDISSSGGAFYSSGKASDGGLSLLINDNETYGFPIGVSGKYTPAELILTNYSDDGYVTINPVDGELKTTDLSSGDILSYYWRVGHEDFTTEPTVQYEFTYDINDDDTGNDHTFYPGKVIDGGDYTRSYENDLTKVDDDSEGGNYTITFNDAGSGFTLENANYTAGSAGRFTGTVEIYYSIATNINDCNWNDGDSWTRKDLLNSSYENHDSRQPVAGDYPQEGDVAVIGWCPWDDGNGNIDAGDPHLIRLRGNIECAQLIFTPMEDISGNPRAREPRYATVFRPCLGIYNGIDLTTGLVEGEGMFWCKQSDPDFSLMDLGEFAVSDSSYILYENYDASRTYVNMPAESPNLMISADSYGRNDHTTIIATEIQTNGNFEIIGDANVELDTDATGDITIGGSLKIFEVTEPDAGTPSGGGGEIRFQNSGSARTITVNGDILLNNEGNSIYVQGAGANNIAHQIIVKGNISQTETGDGLLFSTGIGNDHIDLTLTGNSSKSFNMTAGDVPEFHRIILNKGTNQDSTFTFNGDFNLNGPTSGAGVDKALELQNGTLILDNAGIDINLTTGDDDFEIPTTACLEVKQGEVNVSGDDSGIKLNGKLLISGGTVDMDDAANNGNNYIEYGGSGHATLEISDGTLTVGSQIRRGLSSDAGILTYNQSGGTVIVGKNAAPESNRGVFEVLNPGSSLTLAGGDLYIVREQTAATEATLYLDPESVNLSTGSTINIGNTDTPAGQEFSIYSTAKLQNLTINSTNSPIAKIITVPLSIGGTLTINAGAEFDANGNDLNLYGNFSNSGTFTPSGNTTYFKGSNDQEIDGNTTFYNFINQNTAYLNLASGNADIIINNEFSLESGTILSDNDNSITVKGNINNDGTQLYGGSGDGLILNGTAKQIMTGNGTYGKLTINNSHTDGIEVPVGNAPTITNVLRLEDGVFGIGGNLLTLGINCTVEEGNPFSVDNMIQTNVSFTDNGVRKYYPSGAGTFTFPIGSKNGAVSKYTPVFTNFTQNSSGTGYLTIRPANERHISIIDDSEDTDPDIVDMDNVLQYYWGIIGDNFTDLSGTIELFYDAGDIEVTAPYAITDYITAKLLTDNDGFWSKFDNTDKVDEANNKLIFDFSDAADAAINGDYTAGVDGSSFNGAIPDQVPLYTSNGTGDWDNAATWSKDAGLPAIPNGSRVKINPGDEVTITTNYIAAYSTEVNGTLKTGSTIGNRIGVVKGTGTIYAESGDLPAGYYDEFFTASGGTLEYGGNTNYSTLSNLPQVNNLTYSGTGDREFPNLDLNILGDFTINGGNVINEHNRDITFYSDVVFNGGSYDAKSGKQTFGGSAEQTISGTSSFTGANAFYDLEMNNTGVGLTLDANIEIFNTLILTDGLITPNTGTITITNTASNATSGASASSYINGKLNKVALAGGSFTFPVGNCSQYKPIGMKDATSADTWGGQYLCANPYTTIRNTNDGGELQSISTIDRWLLESAGANTARVTLHWNAHSNVDYTLLTEMRVAKLDGSNEWFSTDEGTGAYAPTGNKTSGTVTSGPAVSFSSHEFTLGTKTGEVLPIELIEFTATANLNKIELHWATATETNNDFFVIERSADGMNFEPIETFDGAGNSLARIDYMVFDNRPVYGTSYYRLKQVDYDGAFSYSEIKPVQFTGSSSFNENAIEVYPNPYNTGELTLILNGVKPNIPIAISINNINGELIYTVELNSPEKQKINLVPMAVNSLSKGIYFVSVKTMNKRVIKKLVVQ